MTIYKLFNIVISVGLLFFGIAMYTLVFINKPIPVSFVTFNMLFLTIAAFRYFGLEGK